MSSRYHYSIFTVLCGLVFHECAAEYSALVTDFECQWGAKSALFQSPVTTGKSGYWMNGVNTLSSNYDNTWSFKYCRPRDPNSDYSTIASNVVALTASTLRSAYSASCGSKAMYSYDSTRHGISGGASDRIFTPKCATLPAQYSIEGCQWSSEVLYHQSMMEECNGALESIYSTFHSGEFGARSYRFECCSVRNTPMKVSSSNDGGYLLHEMQKIESSGDISAKSWTKPNWFEGNIISSTYALADSRNDFMSWTRLCPKGAMTQMSQNADKSLSFICGKLDSKVTLFSGKWSDYIFQSGSTAKCLYDGKAGVIGGIKGNHFASSNEWKYKLLCFDIKRQDYQQTNVVIKIQTGDVAASNAIFTLTLCWDNKLYQGIVIPIGSNTWFQTESAREYSTCGNERALTISTNSAQSATIASVSVTKDGIEYLIHTFDVYATSSATTSTRKTVISMSTSEMRDIDIKFPDNYLLACPSSSAGCIGSVAPINQEYSVTITRCTSYTQAAGTPKIGVIVRGLNDNLDKTVISAFVDASIGRGDVGKILDVTLEHDSGPDVCIQKLEITDGSKIKTIFSGSFFGDGIILSNDCSADGSFRRLTGIQYVPCHTKVYKIETFQQSLYTSVQIHSCTGSVGGILSANSGLLTFTITGLSKNKKHVSSAPLSMKTSADWNAGASRDYTLALFGEFKKVALVSITNNDPHTLCVDSVLINGDEGFLATYYVGGATGEQSIVAVLEWPICKVELTTTITSSVKLPTNPDSAATSTCVNRNRLLSVECEIEQSIETYEEISWEQETGSEVSNSFSMETGTVTSVSLSESFSSNTEIGVEVEGKVTDSVTVTGSVSQSFGYDRNWGSSTDTASASTSSMETTTISVTTDGKVNGKSIAVSCAGSVSVPPSQQVHYTLLVDKEEIELVTLTDMKMTKCSKYLPGLNVNDADHYVYIYGIKGKLKAKSSTNCYVAFDQATQVSPDPKKIDCGKERALAAREWGTFVPQCDTVDATKYKKCQCAYGDKWTEPTCGCVDETTGNFLETAKAAVVAESDTFKWTHWCTQHCGVDSFSLNAAAKAPQFPHIQLPELPQLPKLPQAPELPQLPERVPIYYNYNGLMALAVIGIMIAYVLNSIHSCRDRVRNQNGHKFQALQFDPESETNNI